MLNEQDRPVLAAPVRSADRLASPGAGPAEGRCIERTAELQRRVVAGHYATAAMMEQVARRLLGTRELDGP